MDLRKAIRNRRSIRAFKDKYVKEEPIMVIIDAARWAPSANNSQPWEFLIITEPAEREWLSKLYVEAYKRVSRAELEKKEKIDKMLGVFGDQIRKPPYVIVVCGDRNRSRSYIVDCAAAIQNMLLMAHGLGLGGSWIDLSTTSLGDHFDKSMIKSRYGIPEEVEIVAILPIGFLEMMPRSPDRRAMKEVIHKGFY